MKDELTRPLGIKPQRPSGSGRRHGVMALTLVAVAVIAGGMGGYVFMEGRSARTPAPPAIATPPQAPGVKEPGGQEIETTDLATTNNQEQGGAAAGLAEAAPDGSIEPQVPVPSPRRQEAGLAHLPDPSLVERGATGAIPKRSSDGLRPMDAYSRPPETEGNFGVARVAIIVGGLGISQTSTLHAIDQLPPAVTLAFAPYGNSLTRWMQKARKQGHELLLQVPMQPFDYPRNDPGPHTLRSDVGAQENIANLHWTMSRITNYVGIVNFLGGKFLADTSALEPVFDEIQDRGLLLVDDGSVKGSVAGRVAAQARLPFVRAHIHLDAVNERRMIAERLEDLKQQAKRTGMAIGVASAFPGSISQIAEFARNAASEGIEITPVSAVVEDPARAGSD